MAKAEGLLTLLLLVLFAVLTGCSSESQSPISLEPTYTYNHVITSSAAWKPAKQQALYKISTDPLTRDALAAIKRTGITIEWSYPFQGRNNYGCNDPACGGFTMIGKVNSTTSYVVNMTLFRHLGTSYTVSLKHAYVLQTRKMSSSRTIVSAADLKNRTAIWVDANVSTGGLRTASANSSTVRLTASSPISGYSNLGKLLTVGGSGSLGLTVCQTYTVTAQCSFGGGGSSTIPPAPKPEPDPPCDKNACDSYRSAARSANWKVAGTVLKTGGEAVAFAGACAGAIAALPPAAPYACTGAALATGGAIVLGVGDVMDANADKRDFRLCKERNHCVTCFGRDNYLTDVRLLWQSALG